MLLANGNAQDRVAWRQSIPAVVGQSYEFSFWAIRANSYEAPRLAVRVNGQVLGATLSFVGVALVALGATGQFGADAAGILFGILTASTWAVYSILITPLMQHYSPVRISAVVLPLSWIGIALIGLPHRRTASTRPPPCSRRR